MPLEDSYIATQLLARLVPLSADFIDLILCAFAGVISSGITILEQASLQKAGRRPSLLILKQVPEELRRTSSTHNPLLAARRIILCF